MLVTPEWLHWSLECATHIQSLSSGQQSKVDLQLATRDSISGLKREQVVSDDGGIEQALSLTASKIEFATLPCTVNLGKHN